MLADEAQAHINTLVMCRSRSLQDLSTKLSGWACVRDCALFEADDICTSACIDADRLAAADPRQRSAVVALAGFLMGALVRATLAG